MALKHTIHGGRGASDRGIRLIFGDAEPSDDTQAGRGGLPTFLVSVWFLRSLLGCGGARFVMLLFYKEGLKWLDGMHDEVVPKLISLAHFPSYHLLQGSRRSQFCLGCLRTRRGRNGLGWRHRIGG